jgi:uncharacterized HAD superfamily protein
MIKIENRMTVDEEWEALKSVPNEVNDNPLENGYREMKTGKFIPESDAYHYALERCLNGTFEEQKEFKEMMVEWYYSGGWIYEQKQ